MYAFYIFKLKKVSKYIKYPKRISNWMISRNIMEMNQFLSKECNHRINLNHQKMNISHFFWWDKKIIMYYLGYKIWYRYSLVLILFHENLIKEMYNNIFHYVIQKEAIFLTGSFTRISLYHKQKLTNVPKRQCQKKWYFEHASCHYFFPIYTQSTFSSFLLSFFFFHFIFPDLRCFMITLIYVKDVEFASSITEKKIYK